jgi:hypothetical protein
MKNLRNLIGRQLCVFILYTGRWLTMSISAQRHNYFVRSSVEWYLKFEGMPNISVFLWSSEKYRVYHVLKIRFHTRLLKPRAYGLGLNSANSCEIFHFQLLIYNILLNLFPVYSPSPNKFLEKLKFNSQMHDPFLVKKYMKNIAPNQLNILLNYIIV